MPSDVIADPFPDAPVEAPVSEVTMPPNQQLPTLLPIEVLEGAEVSQWFGLEDALDWVEQPDGEVISVVWRHDSIPFLQLGRVDLRLSSGASNSTVRGLASKELYRHNGVRLPDPLSRSARSVF